MAKKLTEEQWNLVQQDYEVHGMTYSQLIDKWGMSKGTLSRRANKGDWQKGKSEQLVQDKVNAIKDLRKVEQEMEHLVPLEQQAINREAELRLAREEIFIESALMNQKKANELITKTDDDGKPYPVFMKDLASHAQLTNKNKETVLGKDMTTAVQVNNNVGEGSVIDNLVAKHKDKLKDI